MARLRLRIDFDRGGALGPGKVKLLEEIRDLGSISAAARAMDMAYRRAWLLVDSLNQCFTEPVVSTSKGGKAGGGAALTPFGEEVIRRYRAMEAAAHAALADHIAALEAATVPSAGPEPPADAGSAAPPPGPAPAEKTPRA